MTSLARVHAPLRVERPASALAKVMKYEVSDIVRSRWLIAYTLFFVVIADGLQRFSGDTPNALMSLMNVVLVIIPLVNIVFGTMYLHATREFTELLLAQPVGRGRLFGGLYLGLALPLSLAYVAGVAVPFVLHGIDEPAYRTTLLVLLAVGVVLTFAFTGLAFIIALRFEDKVKGFGVAIGCWLFAAVLYDGIVLLAASMFANYPLERVLVVVMLLNPVDLARVLLLLQLDVSALMGYTGAVFKSFFGSTGGIALTVAALAAWMALPSIYALRLFRRKDF